MTLIAPVMDDLITEPQADPAESPPPPAHSDADRISGIYRALAQRIGHERYDLWFDRKTRLRLAGDTLVVEAGNAFSANWIRGKFAAEIKAAAADVLQHPLKLDVRVEASSAVAADQADFRKNTTSAAASSAPRLAPEPAPAPHSPINPKYTLEEFVVGPSNQMAYHASVQVAQHPGMQYNPLFLHGHCGLGKTHLLQGICQRFAKLHPTRKWLYLTGEQFTNEFLEAIRAHKTDAFRRRIRNTDLLVIDDVHFLANKKATQEEFLHTFNQVDASGKQIVLASDCAPKQIQALSDSLTSRFVSGMVLRIDAPDLPTRLAILRRRVARNGWNLSESVLMHVAQSATSSVRELEGMLLQVVAGMSLVNAGSPHASAAVAQIKDRTMFRGPIPADRIQHAVAALFNLTPAALTGSGRDKISCTARAVAMHLARQHTGMSFPEIGRAFGGKNHSTVIAACQRVATMISSGELLRWNTPEGPRHQAIADVLHELDSAIRRIK